MDLPPSNSNVLSPPLPPPQLIAPPPLPPLRSDQVGTKLSKYGPRKVPRPPWPLIVVLAVALPVLLFFGSTGMGLALLGGAIGFPMLLGAMILGLSVVGLITLFRSLRRR